MKLILIGSSTGGPSQLRYLFKGIDTKNTCIIVAQHMSTKFIPSFVNQLNREAISEVCVLKDKEILGNKIYICQNNTILTNNIRLVASYKEDAVCVFKPNVDLLFFSAVPLVKVHKILAIILTGMGDDGAQALCELYKAGAKCLTENELDCVVYGMPKKAKEINPCVLSSSLKEIKEEILSFIEE